MRQSLPDRASQEDVRPPAACPVCRSNQLTTASKIVTAATYWRCVTCGEVWNQERIRTAGQYSPWRR